jgi:ankyrin repeat protein
MAAKRSLDMSFYTQSQLHWTQLNIIRLLVTAGADVYAFDNYGWSPLDDASYYSSEPVFFEALNHCGITREGYIREHDRRQADWNRLHGAKRTAVDAEFMESPSRAGLIKRQERAYEDI